jgi:hypothetical protein
MEAFRLCGWERTQGAIEDIYEESVNILKQLKIDDEKDEDGDGVKDVDQLSAQGLLMRKTQVVMTKCDPEKLDVAMGGFYTSWLAVVATLKIQFAQTITMALSISYYLNIPAKRFIEPAMRVVVPTDYHKWVPVTLGWACKSVAMSIAWYIQRVVSAFTSAIRGGLMCVRHLMKFANKQGITLGGFIPENDEDTYLDEVAGWSMAAIGFYFQYTLGFAVPFPLNILLAPLGILEWWIQWTITDAADPVATA